MNLFVICWGEKTTWPCGMWQVVPRTKQEQDLRSNRIGLETCTWMPMWMSDALKSAGRDVHACSLEGNGRLWLIEGQLRAPYNKGYIEQFNSHYCCSMAVYLCAEVNMCVFLQCLFVSNTTRIQKSQWRPFPFFFLVSHISSCIFPLHALNIVSHNKSFPDDCWARPFIHNCPAV